MQCQRHTKQASCPVCGGQLACFLGVCDEEGEGDVRSLGTRCAARSSSCEYSIKGKCDGSLSVMREKMSVLPSLADFFRQWDRQTEKFALLCSKTKPPIMKKRKGMPGTKRHGKQRQTRDTAGVGGYGALCDDAAPAAETICILRANQTVTLAVQTFGVREYGDFALLLLLAD